MVQIAVSGGPLADGLYDLTPNGGGGGAPTGGPALIKKVSFANQNEVVFDGIDDTCARYALLIAGLTMSASTFLEMHVGAMNNGSQTWPFGSGNLHKYRTTGLDEISGSALAVLDGSSGANAFFPVKDAIFDVGTRIDGTIELFDFWSDKTKRVVGSLNGDSNGTVKSQNSVGRLTTTNFCNAVKLKGSTGALLTGTVFLVGFKS